MIRSAEVRSVIKDIETYRTAVYTFKNKYNCLPGDCPNATSYFGAQDPVPATCQITASTGNLTCDGDGNGTVSNTSVAGSEYEMFRFWQHLAIAELIKGQYTGVSGSLGANQHLLGVNAPTAAIPNSGFSFFYRVCFGCAATTLYNNNYGNAFLYSAQGAVPSNATPSGDVFTPAEAMAVDQKIDDGRPGKGLVIARGRSACTTSVNASDYEGDYKTSVSTIVCALFIKTGL